MDRSQLAHLAQLSRLSLSAEQELSLGAEITQILDLVDSLKAAPVEELEPLSHPHDAYSTLREDVADQNDLADVLLKLAPESNAGFYLVPKVIE